jgi:DNA-binding NarL/FixJ family response regulator
VSRRGLISQCRRYSALPSQPALHIIVFSGRHDARTRDATLDAGTKQYVVKTGRLRPLIEARDRAFTPTTGVLPA